MSDPDRLLTTGEVAALFQVSPKTVRTWTAAGKLSCTRTPGGRARYRESKIRALLAAPDASPGPPPGSLPPAGRGHD